jgi:hypothetical protein
MNQLPVFTPMLNGERLNLSNVVVIEDRGIWERRVGVKGIIQIAGQRYKVYGRSCGTPHCMCDAEIKPIN